MATSTWPTKLRFDPQSAPKALPAPWSAVRASDAHLHLPRCGYQTMDREIYRAHLDEHSDEVSTSERYLRQITADVTTIKMVVVGYVFAVVGYVFAVVVLAFVAFVAAAD